MTDKKKHGFRTMMSHVARRPKTEHGFVNPPLLRGSTVLVPTVKERQALQAKRGERVLTYGVGGSATHWALEDAIAAVEGGTRCYIVPSGLAAVTTPLLAFLTAAFHHAAAGLQVVIEDYVRGELQRFAAICGVNGLAILLWLAASLSILRIAL